MHRPSELVRFADKNQVFPNKLSPRQFRLAIKTLVRTTSPPSHIAGAQPYFSTTLLELVRHRAMTTASSTPLPPLSSQKDEGEALSEQATLVLAIIDSLPCLSLQNLEEWLPLAAEALNTIQADVMREECRKRFWDVLTNGEMDVARAQFCVVWWHTRGGKDFVLRGMEPTLVRSDRGLFASGALGEEAKL